MSKAEPNPDHDPTVWVTRAEGRSKGSIHFGRDCRYIRNKPDHAVLGRPLSHFFEDQDRCGVCGPGGDD